MRRRFALYSMFVLFACAYATLERVPRAAERVLRGGAEHVLRADETDVTIQPLA
jgi:hypothetical protein